MSLQGIFDPIVNAYYKKKYGGGSGGTGSFKELLEAETFSINDPSVTEVRTKALNDIRPRLTSVDLPNATIIGDNAFTGSRSLAKVNLPKATTLGTYCLSSCENLVDLMLENAETIGKGAFYDCLSLKSVYLPNVITIGDSAFWRCQSLENLVLDGGVHSHSVPLTLGNQAFCDCRSLAKLDIDRMVTIDEEAFYRCTNLTALILRYNGVCSINLFSLSETPAMEGAGHIYVPSYVYENYREVYEPQIDQLVPGFFDILFRKIEDYPEITGTN